jgi:hypothetical protein
VKGRFRSLYGAQFDEEFDEVQPVLPLGRGTTLSCKSGTQEFAKTSFEVSESQQIQAGGRGSDLSFRVKERVGLKA